MQAYNRYRIRVRKVVSYAVCMCTPVGKSDGSADYCQGKKSINQEVPDE